MDKNFKLTIEYDGSRYHGWQRQPDAPTIQQEIEAAIQTITRQTVVLTASGRTDAGVHAIGQVANFTCATRIAPEEMKSGLNSILPRDIAIRHCCLMPAEFHARYDVKSKIYQYRIANQPVRPAVGRSYAWWISTPLDLGAMQAAVERIRGKHDFKAFEGAGSPRAHSIRTILDARIERCGDHRLIFTLQADGFLRYMVRNIVGTLAAVGLNKLDEGEVGHILISKNRSLASATAPPHGLFLVKVLYGGDSDAAVHPSSPGNC